MCSKLLVVIWYLLAIVSSGCSGGFSSAQTAPDPTLAAHSIPLKSGYWDIAYSGFGYVNFSTDGSYVHYAPQASVAPAETHATLLLTKKYDPSPLVNFRATIKVTTVSQLRTPTPNAWETFWFFFNYKLDVNGKKMTNYFTLKPNGYELGTAFDEVGQTFLATGGSPTLTLGTSNTMVLEMNNGVLTVSIDGAQIFTYDNNTQVNKMFVHPGNFGLYCEDAEVLVNSVRLEPL